MSNQKLKNIVEGFIFASDKTLSMDQIYKMFPEGEKPEKDEIKLALEDIEKDFENHGIELKKVSSGYRFQVREEFTPWVSRLWDEKPQKYTRALLETLAIIVYRQPITRGEIEEIRGVSVSSNIVKTLQERDWVKIVGHRDVPGRPALLASTKQFLDYFNLQSLEDLPPLSEIKDLDAIATELDPEQNAALISAIREMQEEQGGSAESEESATSESENVEETLEADAQVESPEEIAAELDAVLEEEAKIEAVEGSIESALIEQTKNLTEENQQEEQADQSVENSVVTNEVVSEETSEEIDEQVVNKVDIHAVEVDSESALSSQSDNIDEDSIDQAKQSINETDDKDVEEKANDLNNDPVSEI